MRVPRYRFVALVASLTIAVAAELPLVAAAQETPSPPRAREPNATAAPLNSADVKGESKDKLAIPVALITELQRYAAELKSDVVGKTGGEADPAMSQWNLIENQAGGKLDTIKPAPLATPDSDLKENLKNAQTAGENSLKGVSSRQNTLAGLDDVLDRLVKVLTTDKRSGIAVGAGERTATLKALDAIGKDLGTAGSTSTKNKELIAEQDAKLQAAIAALMKRLADGKGKPDPSLTALLDALKKNHLDVADKNGANIDKVKKAQDLIALAVKMLG